MAFEEDKRICCVVETEEMCCLQCPLGLALEMGGGVKTFETAASPTVTPHLLLRY